MGKNDAFKCPDHSLPKLTKLTKLTKGCHCLCSLTTQSGHSDPRWNPLFYGQFEVRTLLRSRIPARLYYRWNLFFSCRKKPLFFLGLGQPQPLVHL